MDDAMKADLHRYLKRGREDLLSKLDGASEYDVRRPLTPTGTNLLGLVKHVASVESEYFGLVFERPFPEPLPWYADGAEPNVDMWATAEETREEITGLYRRVWAHSDATIEELGLDTPGQVPWWPEGRRDVTLHRILVHVIAETHRHAGHADIVRELVDGAAGCAPATTTCRRPIRRGGRPTASGSSRPRPGSVTGPRKALDDILRCLDRQLGGWTPEGSCLFTHARQGHGVPFAPTVRNPSMRRAGTPVHLALVATTAAFAVLAGPAAAQEAPGGATNHSPFTFAVIGDIPYGADKLAAFPSEIAQINADPSVQFVTHVGDIKDGSTRCDDDYFATIRQDFDQFQDPLVYTVGDNEWTDCHRANNGAYNPLERLSTVRQVFFARPGHTLGQKSVGVESQAGQGVPENVSYTRAGVDFAAMDVVGSNDDLAPWTGLGYTSPTPAQVAEEQQRMAATIDLVNQTFDRAGRSGDRAVVLQLQADMFDPTVTDPQFIDYSAFQPLVQTIAQRSAEFHGPVYLFNGDSHVYNQDAPLASGSTWLSFYGVSTPANNLTRITVDGSGNADDYLRVQVDPHSPSVLSWERIPYTS